MKRDSILQKDVQDAIRWEPLLEKAEIGVIAKDGVVTLTGVVDSYAKKLEAENAAKTVAGVRAIAASIIIQFGQTDKISDTEIANEVLNTLKWNWKVPSDNVIVKVEEGWVTLEGEVKWNCERDAAKKSVENLKGIKGVINNLKIKSETDDEVEKQAIERALALSWSIDDKDIEVSVLGHIVTLSGRVHSMYQKDEAERLAWSSPGVWAVNNELIIGYDF
jgi:osmotically-inducible protein OsmY